MSVQKHVHLEKHILVDSESIKGILYRIYCRTYQFCFRCAAVFLPWRRPEIFTDIVPLAEKINAKGIRKVLIVTDKGLSALGLHENLIGALKNKGILYSVYDKTLTNPSIDNIEEALQLYYNKGCTAIVAMGGGSSIDCAKGVGARIARPNKSVSQMRGQLKVLRKIPFLATIPTTSGSGSEGSLAAVITDTATHDKYAINDPVLIPRYAVLDPTFTLELPPDVTATTGMDALAHAIEAYIGKSNTEQTKEDACMAANLIFENLFTAYSDGKNLEARRNMQKAAYLAGVSFTRAYVGNIHAIAHSLGGKYDTPHGLANAVIMPYVLDAYGPLIYRQLTEMSNYACLAGPLEPEKETAEAFIANIRELNAKMNIPDKINDLKRDDIPELINHALKEANPLYPVPKIFDWNDMEKIYYSILNTTAS